MSVQRENEFYSTLQKTHLPESKSYQVGFQFLSPNNTTNFLPKPEDTRAYQELYPGFIEKMMQAFEDESNHRRILEKEAAHQKKLLGEKLVESQLKNQIKNIELETKEQRHQHIKFYLSLLIGLIVFFSSYWIKFENKFAYIGLYILLAVLGLSPKSMFAKKDKIETTQSLK